MPNNLASNLWDDLDSLPLALTVIQAHLRAAQPPEAQICNIVTIRNSMYGALQAGGIADAEMFRTFNMGIGMVAVVEQAQADQACELLPGSVVLGRITEGSGVDLQL